MFLCYAIGKYYAFDGCSTEGPDHAGEIPGFYYEVLSVAEVACCSLDGSKCHRHDSSGKCWSGYNDAFKKTWQEADVICQNAGYRLCKSQAEVDKCCESGCMHDYDVVWSGNVYIGKNLKTRVPSWLTIQCQINNIQQHFHLI